ncbi:MAG: fasciclin domain-containing protein [Mesotoga sp.]|nr:fasciclin domain-containing protein [Mesotoga sp.]HON28117.1 fasciclin domain-containing protein [Mesotoga infera]
MKKVFLVLVLIGLVFTGFSKNIVELAVSAGNFTTLVAAVEKAGLAGVLTGEGPFTVFAPTDEAFAKLPEGTIESLLNDIPALTRILTYHVVPGKYMSTDVVSLEYLKSAEGSAIPIKVEDGKVYVDNAMITAVDIEASNGVIHVIDSVILPPEKETRRIPEIAIETGTFKTLVTALQEASLVEALMGEGPFTVFAPNDEAFAKLPEGTIESLLKDIPALKNILLYHVVPGIYMAEDVLNMRSLTALNGGQLTVNPNEVKIQGSKIVATDIIAANGVIHVIDAVMIPQ